MDNNDLITQAYRCLETEDYEGAYRFFLEAAISGDDPDALIGLARMYEIGVYVEPDYDRCAHYYELAYRAGAEIPASIYIYIGSTYENGNMYHERDLLRAAYWYRLAAEAGIEFGWECLGELKFKEGNYPLAAYYFKAPEKKNACALYYLGRMYEEGLGVEPDKEEAISYYRRIEEEYPRQIAEGDDHAVLASQRLSRLLAS